jgi:hypothetical protein
MTEKDSFKLEKSSYLDKTYKEQRPESSSFYARVNTSQGYRKK